MNCTISGCELPVKAKGLCSSHYMRKYHYGNPEVPLQRNANGKGSINEDGYKLITVNGKVMREHRHIMEQHLGRKLDPKEHVHHKNGVRNDNHENNLEVQGIRFHGMLSGKKSKGVPKPTLRKEKVLQNCERCGNKFELEYPGKKRRFCGRTCADSAQSDKMREFWKEKHDKF